MRITGQNVIGLPLQGTGQKFVVGGIAGETVCFIPVFGNDSLTEYQPEEPFDVLIPGIKSLLYPGVVQYPVDLFDDVNGGDQDKIQVDPVILKCG